MFLNYAHDRPLFAPWSFKLEPLKRVFRKEALIHCPIQNVAQALKIVIDG